MTGDKSLRDCPYCAEPVKSAAVYCKHCHKDISAPKVEAQVQSDEVRLVAVESGQSGKTISTAEATITESNSAKVPGSRTKGRLLVVVLIIALLVAASYVLVSGTSGSWVGFSSQNSSKVDGSTPNALASSAPDSSRVTVQSLRCYQNGVSATVYNPTSTDFNVSIVLGWYVEEGSPAWEGGQRGVFAQETLYGIAFKGETTTIKLDPQSELNTLGSGTCKVMVFNKWTGGED
jgi:hypothetical protein